MTAETIAAPAPAAGEGLLSRAEQLSLGVRLTLSLIAGGCLILSTGLTFLVPTQSDVAELIAGVAALLVAVPALSAAWQSLRRPDLHGITDQLIALALIAAWAAGDLITAALLPLVMTLGHILEERSLLGSQEAIRALSKLTQVKTRRVRPSGGVEEVDVALVSLTPSDEEDHWSVRRDAIPRTPSHQAARSPRSAPLRAGAPAWRARRRTQGDARCKSRTP